MQRPGPGCTAGRLAGLNTCAHAGPPWQAQHAASRPTIGVGRSTCQHMQGYLLLTLRAWSFRCYSSGCPALGRALSAHLPVGSSFQVGGKHKNRPVPQPTRPRPREFRAWGCVWSPQLQPPSPRSRGQAAPGEALGEPRGGMGVHRSLAEPGRCPLLSVLSAIP